MRLSKSQIDSLTKAAETYHQQMDFHTAGYLEARGLYAAADSFRLGAVVEPLPGHETMAGRLSIPYITPSGVVNLKFRCTQDHECKDHGHPKYLGLPGHRDRLFNVQALHDAKDVIHICEGESDTIAATLADIYAVGISGASKWEPHYDRVFEDFERVVVLADGDSAGKDFAKRIMEMDHASVITFPEGQDVNSFILTEGRDAFHKHVGAHHATS